jgi:hypothetical protein
MIIGDRLRAIREEKKLSRGTSSIAVAWCVVIYRGLKTVVPFLTSKPWRNGLVRWKFRSTSCSMTAKNRPSCRTFRSARPKPIFCGAVPAKRRGCSHGSEDGEHKRRLTGHWCDQSLTDEGAVPALALATGGRKIGHMAQEKSGLRPVHWRFVSMSIELRRQLKTESPVQFSNGC